MDVPHYFTADQVQRLLDALAAHRRHQARTAALIMWRTGLRVSEVLELEWRDLDYLGDPATLLVRKSKNRRARTVRLHQELVQLFTNWPANRSPRDKVVALSMRSALRHHDSRTGIAAAVPVRQQLQGMALELHGVVPGHPPFVFKAQDLAQAQIRPQGPECQIRATGREPGNAGYRGRAGPVRRTL